MFSAIYRTFQKWKINITSMWPANIYFVMWLTDQPTDWPTDWLNDRPTDLLQVKERKIPIYFDYQNMNYSHTIIKRTDRASFLLVWSYTASRMAFSTHFLTLHFLISTTVCIYGLISIGLAFVVSRLGMILQVCTGTAPFSQRLYDVIWKLCQRYCLYR